MRKTKPILEVVLLLFFAASACGQTAPTVHQTATQSSCSNIVALSGAKVDCSNLTPAQRKAIENIPSILKVTLENQDYLDVIMKKLDELSVSRQPVITNNAPGGFAISGGTLINPQVTNSAPIPRRLISEQIESFGSCLAKHTGKVEISALVGNPESYTFAMDWLNVFKRAGWVPPDQKTIGQFMPMIPFKGVVIIVRGEVGINAEDYDKQSAEGTLIGCLNNTTVPGSGSIIQDPNAPTGSAKVEVGAQ